MRFKVFSDTSAVKALVVHWEPSDNREAVYLFIDKLNGDKYLVANKAFEEMVSAGYYHCVGLVDAYHGDIVAEKIMTMSISDIQRIAEKRRKVVSK